MSTYSDSQKEYHVSRMRGLMVLNPDISLRAMKESLEKSDTPLSLSLPYLMVVRNKITKERTYRNNHLNIGPRLAYIQDKKIIVDQRLWMLISDPATGDRAKVAALGFLMKNELDLLAAEMDAGFFERKIGTIKVERGPMNAEHKLKVLAALQKWGVVEAPKAQLSTPQNVIVNPIVNTQPNTL